MNAVSRDLIYLLSCAVNGTVPDGVRVNAMNTEQLYCLAKFHSLRAAVCIALERAGLADNQFHQAYMKAVRKNIYLDAERKMITEEFEKHGIWYLPLKGSVLMYIYPENGMREMADADMLYNAEKQSQVTEIMLAHGYTAESVGECHHDVYMKPPVLNFELHTSLFSEAHAEPLYKYYADINKLLIKDGDGSFGYHLSDEDFYVFMTAHEWKHFSGSGTGIRSLLDCYVYCREKGDVLDWSYITEQCIKLEIADFEKERRQLAFRVFSSAEHPELTDDEQEMLNCYLSAGTYGTFENSIRKKLKGQSKFSFLWHSVFVPRSQLAVSVPFTGKSLVLYPFGVMWRCGRVLIFKRDRLKRMIKVVNSYGKTVQNSR